MATVESVTESETSYFQTSVKTTFKLGIYSSIAVALKGSAWREVSMRLMHDGLATGEVASEDAGAQAGFQADALNALQAAQGMIEKGVRRMSVLSSSLSSAPVAAKEAPPVEVSAVSASVEWL